MPELQLFVFKYLCILELWLFVIGMLCIPKLRLAILCIVLIPVILCYLWIAACRIIVACIVLSFQYTVFEFSFTFKRLSRISLSAVNLQRLGLIRYFLIVLRM
jgi:hypothetical protein